MRHDFTYQLQYLSFQCLRWFGSFFFPSIFVFCILCSVLPFSTPAFARRIPFPKRTTNETASELLLLHFWNPVNESLSAMSLAQGDLPRVPGSEGAMIVVKHDCCIDCAEHCNSWYAEREHNVLQPRMRCGGVRAREKVWMSPKSDPSQDPSVILPDGCRNRFGGCSWEREAKGRWSWWSWWPRQKIGDWHFWARQLPAFILWNIYLGCYNMSNTVQQLIPQPSVCFLQ